MPWTVLLSVLAHHGETADPELLEWIKQLLDHLLTVGPWTVVIVVGLVLITFPVGLVLFYLAQNRHLRHHG